MPVGDFDGTGNTIYIERPVASANYVETNTDGVADTATQQLQIIRTFLKGVFLEIRRSVVWHHLDMAARKKIGVLHQAAFGRPIDKDAIAHWWPDLVTLNESSSEVLSPDSRKEVKFHFIYPSIHWL